MKKKILIPLITIIITIIILSQVIPKTTSVNLDSIKEKHIKENTNNFEVNITYPLYKYSNLNNKIIKIINNYINTLKSEKPQNNIPYTLNINYKEYKYQNYLSLIFFITTYTGGAHPNHYIKSLIYDISKHNFMTIENLIQKDQNILEKLSTYSRKELIKNNFFDNDVVKDMMQSGTSPIKENFKNIALTDKGLLVFFERYQIAPYYFGDYSLIIPYNILK